MKVIQVLVAVDQLTNTLLAGYADETLSARAYRCRGYSYAWWATYKTINGLFFWMDDHCKQAYESEKLRTQLPPEYRV